MQTVLRVLAPLLILSVGVGGLIALGMIPDKDEATAPPPVVPEVRVSSVEEHLTPFEIKVDGVVVPHRDILLSAEVAGRITRKAAVCNEGNYVASGTLLLEIDRRDYELEVQRVQEELRQAEVDLKELEIDRANTAELINLAEQELALQQKEVGRLESLSGNLAISQSDVDRERRGELTARNRVLTFRNDYQLLNTRYARLQSGRALANIQLEKAQLDLARTQISASVDGVVLSDFQEEGAYVRKGDQLVTIDDTLAAEVKCNLRMDELYWLWNQKRAEPAAPSLPGVAARYQLPPTPATVVYRFVEGGDAGYEWEGRLDRFDGIGLDEKTRTAPCRVVVSNPRQARLTGGPKGLADPPALVRGMFVSVIVRPNAPSMTKLFKVPERAVRPDKTIWVVRRSRSPAADQTTGTSEVEGNSSTDNQLADRLFMLSGVRLVQLFEDKSGTVEEPGRSEKYWLVAPNGTSLTSEDKVVVSSLALVDNGMRVIVKSEETK